MEDPLAPRPPRRPHRERRHRRKASDAAAAALAAQAASSYGDVFGGPPRFAPPPAFAAGAGTTAPADYAEVFGGVAASCSIPYLDLPPAVASGDGAGAGGYGEIFGRFDFGDFAVPYEDMLPSAESLVEEIALPSGSSRSLTRKESAQLDAEPSILYQQVPDTGSGRHFDDEEFHSVSFPPDSEQTFTMSYNKTTRGRPDDLFEMTACVVEPSISYVVDSCNLSNDSEMDYDLVMDSGTHVNGVKEKMSPPNVADSSLESADSAYVVDQQQYIPTCPPISEYICQDENDNKRSSTHSVSSEEAPSPDYPFLRVSDINLPAAPIKVQPPPMPQSKLLNKKGSNENGDSDVNRNSVAAAAAMKEAMEFAEARLKAAKELMERKGGSFKFRKQQAHHRNTKSTEMKEFNVPKEVHLFEENLNMRRLAKEGNQSNDIALLNRNMGSGSLKPVHSDHDKKGIISPGKPREMMQNVSELEQLGEWTSDANFYELVSNDQKCRTNEAACKGDNGLMTNSLAKLDRSENEKPGGFAGESKRFRKLWDINNTTFLQTEHVNQGKDGIDSVEAEQKTPRSPEVMEHVNQGKDGIDSVEAEQKTPSSPEVTPCDERATYQEPTKGNNGLMTNSSTKLDQSEKVMEGGFVGEPKRSRKLWGSNSTTVLRTEHVNLVKDGIAFVEAEEKTLRFPEVPPCDERVASQEVTDSHLKQCPGVGNSLGHENDAHFEISHMNNLPAKVHVDPEISSTFSEPCLSGGHAIGNENHSESTAQETPLVGKSNQDVNSKEELQLPCIDGLPSARNQILQEHSNVINADEINENEVKISKLEESSKSFLNFEEEKILSFVDESCLQNKNGSANEVYSESLIHEKMTKFGIEEKADAHEDFQEGDMDQVAGSAEEEGYVTSGSGIANESEYEEAEADIFVGDMESNVRTCGSFDKDPYQCQESQGSWGPQDLDNRLDRVSDTISHGKQRETKECLLDNVVKTVAEVLNHDSREGQKSTETVVYIKPKHACAEFNVSSDRDGNLFDSADELVTDDGNDYAMKMSTMPNNLQASFSEACSSMQHLSQKPESVSAEKADESTPVLENLEVDRREAGREIPNKNCTVSEEGKNIGSEIEEREREDNISNVRFVDQQPFCLDSDIRPKAAEDTASETILKSREENLNAHRTKVRNDIKETEGEVEKEVRLDEEKEKECKNGKEKKQDKERRRRELEEEKEREMERAKDRLAVQRATREAHERAFAEVRAKAERIALERITSARQRASAEAHEKEEKATAQAALEQASREARMKAERAAVERATAEARERAIEKAKAAADAKERMGKFRSSFKDSFKAPNQDNQQEASFQKTAYNKHGKSMDSCVEVVEVESALRHKAKLERHQRTAERAAKALAEKNMRDMLVQREQAEKHRLAEFLDPEVKRWSNGKEGNLRALLSTLQYILGSDSGWQSVPLTDLITAAGVKKAYKKATLCVHPDKVQQRGATIRHKYICEKVFDLLKEAWNKYNSEER